MTSAAAFVGLDVGTTGVKAVAFDGDDAVLATAVVPTPTSHRLIARKTEIGGRPIEVAELVEATALGAARLGRRALEE